MPGTPVFRDSTRERELALEYAVGLHRTRFDETDDSAVTDGEMIATATTMFRWLTGPAHLVLVIGPVTDQTSGLPDEHPLGGNPMQLRATQQFPASVALADARGNAIGDQPGTQDDVTWTVEGDDVLDLEVSEDSRTATVKASGPVGSAVLRASVGELFVTLAVDVVPGEAALITIDAGEPTEQDVTEPV